MTIPVDLEVDTVPLDASWAEIILSAIEGRLAEVHTGLPAKVVSFDPSTQSCSVQPLLVRVTRDENGTLISMRIPVLTNVPIVYPTFGTWSITGPLAVDDIVFLAFAERSLDNWLDAEKGLEVIPRPSHKHDLSDAIAIPGMRQRGSAIPNISTENLRIANEAGTVLIELSETGARVKGPGVKIDAGGTADQHIPCGERLIAAIQAITVVSPLGPTSTPVNASMFPSTLSENAMVK